MGTTTLATLAVDELLVGGSSVSRRLLDTVSLADHWTPGDPVTKLPAAFTAAYGRGKMLEIPSSFHGFMDNLTNQAVSVPDGKDLAISCRVKSTVAGAQINILGSSEVYCAGGRLQDVVLALRSGTPRVYGLKASGYLNAQLVAMRGTGGAVFDRALIHDFDFSDCNYGFLATGNDHSARQTQLTKGRGRNLRSDFIEFNLCPNDSGTQVIGHTIENIDGSAANWGIGIGFAGYGVDAAMVPADYFVVADIFGRSLRQLCHAEISQHFDFSGIRGENISSAYGAASGMDVGLVCIYGSSEFSVGGLRGQGDVLILPQGTTSPCYNFSLKDVNLRSGNISVTPGNPTYNPNAIKTHAELQDIYTDSGFIEVDERTNGLSLKDVRARRPRSLGAAFKLKPDLNVDGRQAFRAGQPNRLTVIGCGGWDEFQANSTDVGGIVQGNVNAHDNNFTVAPSIAAGRVNRWITYPSAGAFPYGPEFVAGDMIVCSDTGQMFYAYQGGSRTRAGDAYTVDDAANGIIRSNAAAWTSLNQHEVGQFITLVPFSGSNQFESVVSVFVADGYYKMKLSGPIGATNGTTGTLTSTNAVGFRKVGSDRVVLNGDISKALSIEETSQVQIWNEPLTAHRGVTLNTSPSATGRFRIVRTALATGAFNLDVYASFTRTLAPEQWCDVAFDGAAWRVIGFGSL